MLRCLLVSVTLVPETKIPEQKGEGIVRKSSLITRFCNASKRQWPFYVMMLPGIAFIFILYYLPMPGILLAFKDYKPTLGIFGSPWKEPLFANFTFFFTSDTAARVTFNTLFYNVIEMVSVTVGAVALAILLNEVSSKFISATYKGIILIPTFLSWIVIQYIVFGLLSVDRGIVNSFLSSIGMEAVQWYSEPGYWRLIMPFAYLWKNIGYYSVLYVAAIAGISTEYYEAAELDGATKWQQIRYITIPLLQPTVIVLSLLWIGKLFNGGLGDWNGFYTITNNAGVLYPATDVIDTYVYRALRGMNDYGMSAAVGLYQSVVGLILVFFSNLFIKKIDPDSAMF